MEFSVIYEFDAPRGVRVYEYAPPHRKKLWQLTETSSRWSADPEELPLHRKYVAILNKEQFEEFISVCDLVAENVETLGSLGAPGFEMGWAPAISFRSESSVAWQSAYVTPLPKTKREVLTERDWQRVRKAVIRQYGYW